MSTIRDTVIALVEKSKATWDFDTAAAELTAVIEAVQRDGTLAEISKRPLINIGNVALKVSEGLAETIRSILRESLEATLTRKLGYALSKAAYRDFKKRIDYSRCV